MGRKYTPFNLYKIVYIHSYDKRYNSLKVKIIFGGY